MEIHGAHGYLIDEFFWDKSNLRSDRYGGSIAGRARFAAEIIAVIRNRVGPGFPIVFRWSQWKQQDYGARLVTDPASLEAFLAPLIDAGVDIFDCSTRRYYQPEFPSSPLNLAGWVKKISGKATIAVGSIGLDSDLMPNTSSHVTYQNAQVVSLDDLLERLDEEEFDLVAVGRGLLANPDWAELVRAGNLEALRPFTKDMLRHIS